MPKSVNAWDTVFANKDGAGADEGKVRSKHGGHSPVAVKVQKETQERKERAAFRFGKIHLNSCKCFSSTLSTSGKI